MDRHRMSRKFSTVFVMLLGLSLGACTMKEEKAQKISPKTFFKVNLASKAAFEEISKFLDWIKGYEVSVKDPDRGLIVTGWTFDNPLEKYQLTVRIEEDLEGSSIVSVHRQAQFFEANQWKESLTNPAYDAEIIREIRKHLRDSRTSSR